MVSSHCWMRAYSARSAPQTPGAQVRYLKREGEFDPARYVQRTSEKTKDYGDYAGGDVRNMPAWAEKDASRFFTQAAQSERANGYYAFQVEFSLPRELTHEQHLALAHDFMDATMPDLPALWVKHEKQLETGEMHPHIHILFSARKQDGIERSPAQMFHRWNADHPARGGCAKDLFWSQRQAPELLRHAFADMTNFHLERAGAEERLDVRSLKRQGSQRPAMRHGQSERPDAATLAREQAQARRAWEQRKAYKGLGNVPAIPREEFVLLVRGWTRDHVPGTAVPRSSAPEVAAYAQRSMTRLRKEEEELCAGIKHLTEHLVYVRGEQARTRQPARLTDLARQVLRLPRRGEDEQAAHGKLRVRLHEDERDGGMSW